MQPSVSRESGAAWVAPLRILLIEDMRHMQTALRELIETIGGFEIVAIQTSEMAATQWIEDHPFEWDVVTVDLMLDDGSGFNLIRRCRNLAPDSEIVVLSDFVSPAVESHCISLGANAVYRKSDAQAFADYMTVLSESAARG